MKNALVIIAAILTITTLTGCNDTDTGSKTTPYDMVPTVEMNPVYADTIRIAAEDARIAVIEEFGVEIEANILMNNNKGKNVMASAFDMKGEVDVISFNPEVFNTMGDANTVYAYAYDAALHEFIHVLGYTTGEFGGHGAEFQRHIARLGLFPSNGHNVEVDPVAVEIWESVQ